MLANLEKGETNLEYILNNPLNELEMVQKAAEGDSLVFRSLFDNNVSRVYSLCFRMSAGDVLLSEEITQDVFVKAWENLGKFRGESSFPTWLHRIAVNEFLMRKRSEKRMMQKVVMTDDLSKFDGRHDSGNRINSSNIDLEKAISSLPEQARIVFVLHDVNGYKHEEISDMINIEVGTSKAHLHRARKLLREELSK